MSRVAVIGQQQGAGDVQNPAETVQGIDISNWNGDIRGSLEQWTGWGVEHVCVRLSTESANHRAIAIDQLQVAHAVGLTVSGYCWAYFGMNPGACVAASLDVARASGVPLSFIWLDAEDEPGGVDPVAWLRAAADEVAQLGWRVGVYSAAWWWNSRAGGSEGCSDLPLWAAAYDDDPNLESVGLFGGWARESLAGKQWSGDPIDRDTFARWVTEP